MKKCTIIFLVIALSTSAYGINNDHTHHDSASLTSSIVSVKEKELKGAESRDPREPPPEFYRTGGTGSNNALPTYDRERYGNLLNRPDRYNNNNDKGSFITSTSSASKFGTGYGLNTQSYNRDRLGSGTSSYGSSNYGGTSTTGGYGYVPPSNPYEPSRQPPYGQPQPVDPHSMYPGYNVYDGYIVDDNSYGGYGSGNGKDLTKKILIPLAGAAILGVAAALMANPVLLNLGAASGKRKRRDITHAAQELAYNAYESKKY